MSTRSSSRPTSTDAMLSTLAPGNMLASRAPAIRLDKQFDAHATVVASQKLSRPRQSIGAQAWTTGPLGGRTCTGFGRAPSTRPRHVRGWVHIGWVHIDRAGPTLGMLIYYYYQRRKMHRKLAARGSSGHPVRGHIEASANASRRDALSYQGHCVVTARPGAPILRYAVASLRCPNITATPRQARGWLGQRWIQTPSDGSSARCGRR